MPRLVRSLLVLTCVAVLLSACADPDAVDQPILDEPLVNEAVLGSWTVIEENGTSPSEPQRLAFSPEGELTRTTLSDSTISLAQYTFVAENQLSVTDATGTHLYDFTLEDKGMMHLTEPGENGATLLLQRIAERIEPPPPTSTDIPEDSLPADSL